VKKPGIALVYEPVTFVNGHQYINASQHSELLGNVIDTGALNVAT